jgi:choline-glycine betaine transporter
MATKKAFEAAAKLKNEMKTVIVTAITAAFALIIALTWNDAIKEVVTAIVAAIGLQAGNVYLYKIYTALIITAVCVVAIILFSRWGAKKSE